MAVKYTNRNKQDQTLSKTNPKVELLKVEKTRNDELRTCRKGARECGDRLRRSRHRSPDSPPLIRLPSRNLSGSGYSDLYYLGRDCAILLSCLKSPLFSALTLHSSAGNSLLTSFSRILQTRHTILTSPPGPAFILSPSKKRRTGHRKTSIDWVVEYL